jgi:hypothetical protein
MIFNVLPWRSPIPQKSKEPLVILIQDNWDDYGFHTTFHATVVTESGPLELGTVKILHVNQEAGLPRLNPPLRFYRRNTARWVRQCPAMKP